MTKDWVHGVGHFPVCQILLQIVVRVVITSSPPAWTSFTINSALEFWSQSPMLLLNRTALVALSWRFLFIRIRLALMLYFFIVANKSCMPNPVEVLLEVYEDMYGRDLAELQIFLTKDL